MFYPEIEPLKNSFADTVNIGATLSRDVLMGQDPLSEAIARHHFNAFTAENSMKPQVVQPVEGQFNFAEADRLVEIAHECGARVVGHTLVWHNQTPDWFWDGREGRSASRVLVLARLRRHIAAVVGRYRGHIAEWDVLNEVISDKEDEYLRPNPWLNLLGARYISEIFRAAHEADPEAILIYNDYNIERGAKHQKTLRLLKSLLDDGVPVHAVGIQGHWHLHTPDLAEIEAAIENFAALGLKVCITELDVSALPSSYEGADITRTEALRSEMNPFVTGLPEEVEQQLAQRYRDLFALFLRHSDKIERVTLWGVHDGFSWLNDFPIRGRTDYPLLFDRHGQPKASYFAVENAGKAARNNLAMA